MSKGYSYLRLSVKVLLVLSVVLSYKCKHINLLLKLSRIIYDTIRSRIKGCLWLTCGLIILEMKADNELAKPYINSFLPI